MGSGTGLIMALVLAVLGAFGCARPAPQRASTSAPALPGAREDGSILLPNQWSLRPVGRQVSVGDFPVNLAVHPAGRYAAVLHCGYGPHEVAIVDLERHRLCSRVELDEAFYGLAFTPDGRRLLASGAGMEAIHVFDFADGALSRHRPIELRPVRERGVSAGLTVAPDGRTLYVANVFGQSLSLVDLEHESLTAEIRLGSPDMAPAPGPGDPLGDVEDESITKRAEALLRLLNREAPYPYACAVDPARRRLYVSLWAMSSVLVLDLETRVPVARWTVQEHPNELILTRDGRHLFVANANRNTVSVLETTDGRTLETLAAELEPGSPPGSTPNSLALSPDESRLFVANANINALAVFDVRQPGRSRSLGFIPTGWYPTSVRLTPDGRTLLIANGKGLMPRANRHGPQPGREPPSTVREYIGGLLRGTVGILALPEALEPTLKTWTARALAGRPPSTSGDTSAREPGHPIPTEAGGASPIRYCIYVVKENRTYDQVLGDLPAGNGDPSLCLFPEPVTPNHHQLAREFVLLDNFYVESEVSADGHEWSMGAYATDYVEKTWPLSYGHNARRKYAYPSEGRFRIAEPAGGYLWDRAREAGVTYRSYGEFVNNGATPKDPCTTLIAALQDHFDPWFRSFDMEYSDLARADRFISELRRFEQEGDMPRLQIVRLPNDHTAGTSPGKLTPTAFLAENDLAFGRVIEAISRSKFWPQTAVFVVEDDAQNGPDHVDAHRTIAYVISPYTRRGTIDSTLYSTASMLRTIELILGLKPMSQFDAAAQPMRASFQAKPDLKPYTARTPQVDWTARTPATAWGAELSRTMDFAREDAADDLQLNEVIWRFVNGADHPMPGPIRAGFVLAEAEEEVD